VSVSTLALPEEVDYADEKFVAHEEAVRALGQELDGILGVPLLGPSKVGVAWEQGFHSVEDLRHASFETVSDLPGFGGPVAEVVYTKLGGTLPPGVARRARQPPVARFRTDKTALPARPSSLTESAERPVAGTMRGLPQASPVPEVAEGSALVEPIPPMVPSEPSHDLVGPPLTPTSAEALPSAPPIPAADSAVPETSEEVQSPAPTELESSDADSRVETVVATPEEVVEPPALTPRIEEGTPDSATPPKEELNDATDDGPLKGSVPEMDIALFGEVPESPENPLPEPETPPAEQGGELTETIAPEAGVVPEVAAPPDRAGLLPEPPTLDDVTGGSIAPEPVAPAEGVPEPTPSAPITAAPFTPESEMLAPIGPAPATPEPALPAPADAEPATPEPEVSESAGAEAVPAESIATGPIVTEPTAPEQTGSEPTSPEPRIPESATTGSIREDSHASTDLGPAEESPAEDALEAPLALDQGTAPTEPVEPSTEAAPSTTLESDHAEEVPTPESLSASLPESLAPAEPTSAPVIVPEFLKEPVRSVEVVTPGLHSEVEGGANGVAPASTPVVAVPTSVGPPWPPPTPTEPAEPEPPAPSSGVELMVGDSLVTSLGGFLEAASAGHHGVCVVRETPERIRARVGSRPVEVFWLTNIGRGPALRPSDLEGAWSFLSRKLLEEQVTAFFLEGIEYLVRLHGADAVLNGLVQFDRLARENDARIWVYLAPSLMKTEDLERFRATFGGRPAPT